MLYESNLLLLSLETESFISNNYFHYSKFVAIQTNVMLMMLPIIVIKSSLRAHTQILQVILALLLKVLKYKYS